MSPDRGPEASEPFPLTFPDPEAAFLRDAYTTSKGIIEYGSGGSTRLAAQLGIPVLSIESDRRWANALNDALVHAPKAMVRHVDIGRTGDWGFPKSTAKSADYWRYPMSPWIDPPLHVPDLVLIDGRFRKACAITTALMAKSPLRLIFDDWRPRRSYHDLTRLLTPVGHVGRLAVFDITPGQITAQDLPRLLPWFSDTR